MAFCSWLRHATETSMGLLLYLGWDMREQAPEDWLCTPSPAALCAQRGQTQLWGHGCPSESVAVPLMPLLVLPKN